MVLSGAARYTAILGHDFSEPGRDGEVDNDRAGVAAWYSSPAAFAGMATPRPYLATSEDVDPIVPGLLSSGHVTALCAGSLPPYAVRGAA